MKRDWNLVFVFPSVTVILKIHHLRHQTVLWLPCSVLSSYKLSHYSYKDKSI